MTAKDPEIRNRGLIKALHITAWVMGILGVLVTAVLLFRFARGGMYAEARLEPMEVATAVLAGFYHYLLAFLCRSIARALAPAPPHSGARNIGFLRFFGWGAILIGIVGAFVIFPKHWGMGAMMWYHVSGALAFAVYSAAFGIPCLGVAALLKGLRREGGGAPAGILHG